MLTLGLKENRKKLQLRPDDFGRILTEDIGFLRDGKPLLSGGDNVDGAEEEKGPFCSPLIDRKRSPPTLVVSASSGFNRMIEIFVKPSASPEPAQTPVVLEKTQDGESSKKERRKKKREREADGNEPKTKTKKKAIS